ncbi:MAG: type II toxin-antitoxin system prevent-host-death family antitoxin [Chromatiaceae bacterium]|jgi:hypothetical protein|nr:type II toxin-antitoxin system prevent-host-death family antitoxin [Chromatiaceae bacterium]
MIELHPEYLTRHGKPQFAVLPIEEFDRLKAYLEDLEDLLALRQAKDAEAGTPAFGIEELRRRLAADEPDGERR